MSKNLPQLKNVVQRFGKNRAKYVPKECEPEATATDSVWKMAKYGSKRKMGWFQYYDTYLAIPLFGLIGSLGMWRYGWNEFQWKYRYEHDGPEKDAKWREVRVEERKWHFVAYFKYIALPAVGLFLWMKWRSLWRYAPVYNPWKGIWRFFWVPNPHGGLCVEFAAVAPLGALPVEITYWLWCKYDDWRQAAQEKAAITDTDLCEHKKMATRKAHQSLFDWFMNAYGLDYFSGMFGAMVWHSLNRNRFKRIYMKEEEAFRENKTREKLRELRSLWAPLRHTELMKQFKFCSYIATASLVLSVLTRLVRRVNPRLLPKFTNAPLGDRGLFFVAGVLTTDLPLYCWDIVENKQVEKWKKRREQEDAAAAGLGHGSSEMATKMEFYGGFGGGAEKY